MPTERAQRHDLTQQKINDNIQQKPPGAEVAGGGWLTLTQVCTKRVVLLRRHHDVVNDVDHSVGCLNVSFLYQSVFNGNEITSF